MKPGISVIIPIYNVEKYLAKCLDSVINQTLNDIEIICVNDGSTDNSLEILSQYAAKDSRIKVITKENAGVASARNTGLEAAKSDYIGFVDSDDWIEPETYETALNKMLEDPEIDLVCWGCNVTTEEGVDYLVALNYHTMQLAGKNELSDDNCFKTTVTLVNKIFKQEIIQKNNILFPCGLLFEDDFFFWSYVANCSYAYYIDKYFYNYIRRKKSITGCSYGKEYTAHFRFLIWESIYDYYKQKNISEKKKELLEKLFIIYYDLEISHSLQTEKVTVHAKKMIKKYKLKVRLHDKTHYSFAQRIFSIKNSHEKTHKVLTILGIKMKFRKKRIKCQKYQ